MDELREQITKLLDTDIKQKVDSRLKDFESFRDKSEEEWFSEMCFCILTANSKARTALAIQDELQGQGFLNNSAEKVCNIIIKHKHRFHNNKTKYIVEARKHFGLKSNLQSLAKEDERKARDWLAENIKGYGYKEASHFMRNVGYKNLAILDRHIINLMLENNIISTKPKTLTKKIYHELEDKFLEMSDSFQMSAAELDLYMWYLKGGDVLK
jgi:N-glycosylase/DNA lyase